MSARALIALVAIMMIAAGCDRTETSTTAAVATTTPSGTSTSPSPADASRRHEALVRVVHAAPGGHQLDLFAGDLIVFDGLGFKSVTPYRALDGKRYAFALRPAGMTQAKALSTNTEGLHDGRFYTAFAMPGDGRVPALRIVHDRLDLPASGKAQLRIVHAGVDAGEIDVREAGGASLFEGVDFQSVTDYREITPVNGVIEIVGNNDGSPLLTSFNTHLDAGRYYTILIVGSAAGAPKLEAFMIEDALAP